MTLKSLRPLGLAVFTLGASSLVYAQYGTAPAYPPTYPGAPSQPTRPATPPSGTAPVIGGPGGIAQTLNSAERTQNAQQLLLLYGQAVTQPELARAAISQLLANYYTLRNGAQSADQATQAVAEAGLRFQVFQAAQNQVMVQQNQQILQQNARIIALLEAQNRTKATPANR